MCLTQWKFITTHNKELHELIESVIGSTPSTHRRFSTRLTIFRCPFHYFVFIKPSQEFGIIISRVLWTKNFKKSKDFDQTWLTEWGWFVKMKANPSLDVSSFRFVSLLFNYHDKTIFEDKKWASLKLPIPFQLLTIVQTFFLFISNLILDLKFLITSRGDATARYSFDIHEKKRNLQGQKSQRVSCKKCKRQLKFV